MKPARTILVLLLSIFTIYLATQFLGWLNPPKNIEWGMSYKKCLDLYKIPYEISKEKSVLLVDWRGDDRIYTACT